VGGEREEWEWIGERLGEKEDLWRKWKFDLPYQPMLLFEDRNQDADVAMRHAGVCDLGMEGS
jgi:hypothetical protein